MKKKAMIGAAVIIVVVAFAALLVFALSGNNQESQVTLTGIWKVASNVTDGEVSIPQDEYMVFTEKEARDFRDGNNTPYLTSSYSIQGDTLSFKEIERSYKISKKTDSYISLYTNDNTFMTIIKAESEEILKTAFDPDSITGKWNVTYRPTETPILNEYLVFSEGLLSDYRNNAEEPAVRAEYSWEGNIIRAEKLGIEMIGARVAADQIVLTDPKGGYVWLLTEEK